MMGKIPVEEVLKKYGKIIEEEINVKEVSSFENEVKVSKVFKPIGSKLSAKFGKDTGKVIQFGKKGNIEELGDGKVKVFDDDGNERILEDEDYEISYEGLEGDDIAVDSVVLVKLDLEITPELQKEGVAREISRFLNQMRKDADFAVDDKVSLEYFTKEDEFEEVLSLFEDFLIQEALLKDVKKAKDPEGDIVALFDLEEKNIKFGLRR